MWIMRTAMTRTYLNPSPRAKSILIAKILSAVTNSASATLIRIAIGPVVARESPIPGNT